MTTIKRRTPKPEPAPEAVAPQERSNTYIRRWAKSRGIKVSAKGKLSAAVIKAFNERGPDDDTILDDPEMLEHNGRQVHAKPEERALPTGKTNRKRYPCEFCRTNPARHDLCPGLILNGKLAPKPVHVCLCFEGDPESHDKGMRRLGIAPYAQYAGLILKEAS